MQLFFGHVNSDVAILTLDEARHAIRVLRKKEGDVIDLIDGGGTLYSCQIVEVKKNEVLAKVLDKRLDFGKVSYDLHVAIAPTKNIDRFEWFLEKATEMGISSIFPITTFQSERTVIKPERLNRVLLAASKQSLKGKIPTLHPLQTWKSFVKQDFGGEKFIAHCADGEKADFSNRVDLAKPTLICIGPEGDFTEEEVNAASANGFVPVSLGSSRLRTETAGLVAVASVYAKSHV